MPFSRVIWIVLDSMGIGPLPDAAEYGDAGRNTLGHVASSRALAVPNLVRLGLGNIEPLAHLVPPQAPAGCFGKGATRSPGKDATTGYWEMAGIWVEQAFSVYKHGFPRELIGDRRRRKRKGPGTPSRARNNRLPAILVARLRLVRVVSRARADGKLAEAVLCAHVHLHAAE